MRSFIIFGLFFMIGALGTYIMVGNTAKTQAETVTVPAFVTDTPTPTDLPTPTDIPTPTVDIQALQEKAVLQTRLQYVNAEIAQLQKKINFEEAVDQDMWNSILQDEKDPNVNVSPIAAKYAQFVQSQQIDHDNLNQFIEERKEIQAVLGIN